MHNLKHPRATDGSKRQPVGWMLLIRSLLLCCCCCASLPHLTNPFIFVFDQPDVCRGNAQVPSGASRLLSRGGGASVQVKAEGTMTGNALYSTWIRHDGQIFFETARSAERPLMRTAHIAGVVRLRRWRLVAEPIFVCPPLL